MIPSAWISLVNGDFRCYLNQTEHILGTGILKQEYCIILYLNIFGLSQQARAIQTKVPRLLKNLKTPPKKQELIVSSGNPDKRNASVLRSFMFSRVFGWWSVIVLGNSVFGGSYLESPCAERKFLRLREHSYRCWNAFPLHLGKLHQTVIPKSETNQLGDGFRSLWSGYNLHKYVVSTWFYLMIHAG